MSDDLLTTDTRIAALAKGQHGVVTLDQVRAAGVTAGQLRGRVASGALVLVAAGVYRVAGSPRTWEQRALESCLAAGGGAVLCRRAAAHVWCLDVPAPATIEVAIPHRRSVRRSAALATGARVHRVRTLDAGDRTRAGTLPVTTVPRTLVDLAGVLQPAVLGRVLDDALSRRLARPLEVSDTLRRLGGSRRAGAAYLRKALVPWLGGQQHDSAAEADCRRLLAAHGLPASRSQYPVTCLDGRTALLDFAWPQVLVALEVDGFRWHGNPAAHAGDSLRANQLAALGWTVLRVTPTELATRPGPVLGALRRRLASAG
jgi:predicted transcriptional regulator of viral defense system